MTQTRRDFLQSAAVTALTLTCPLSGLAQSGRKPQILLRGSWQIVNIGDIAHTPGALALIEKYLPEAEMTLWSSGDLSPDVSKIILTRFPKLKIVKGKINADGKGSTPELQAALLKTDFLLHGSGASFVAQKDVGDFAKHFKKPYGIYGITFSGTSDEGLELLSNARFVFFRDTVSLGHAKTIGVKCPIMEFGPDGAFGCDLRNDAAADAYLQSVGLEPGKFLCCIPRYRFTPYWLIKEKNRAIDHEKANRNEEMREHDHRPLRDAITAVVRETGHKVLLCPEDMTQMAIGKDDIYDKLDADVQKQVVWRDKYWLTDEALSTYTRSLGLFGLEMHSPIMCIGNGIPAIVGRFDEQTSKGLMWRDIGLGDWLFDMDQPAEVARLTPTVLSFITDRPAVLEKTGAARQKVQQHQQETMQIVRNSLT